jgi:hypothetical protein
MPRPNTQGDFWMKVDIRHPDECWPWTACTNKLGYGLFRYGNRKQHLSHRLALKFSGVDLPDDKCACHKCDNPSCCNPFHLFVGTNADNAADRHKKGRTKIPPRPLGSRHPLTKLTEEQVLAMRAFSGTHREAGAAFGVTMGAAKAIRQRRNWSHI